ncbi:hypothetical protein QYE76_029467 [Lolium multiflorum]|uniref:CCHC-type domain-containing protein n=1 Tax=Lolium multiflorum TaxID=4521 RepID=A0AAD8VGQ0_LOLMU|nr:hypothetical protein QYE76_029467 [Lolium multiflorum]
MLGRLMCLTQRFCSGDSGGDWELALPERRRRRAARRPGGRRVMRASPTRKGNRFSPLATVVAEAEGSEVAISEFSEVESGDLEVLASWPLPHSPANRGRFRQDLVVGATLGPARGSSRERSLSPAPPPPLESPSHFPPLPGQAPRGRDFAVADLRSSGDGQIRIGALVLELPQAPGRPEARGTPPPLGFASASAELTLGAAGPAGLAHSVAGANAAQLRPVRGAAVGSGPVLGALGPFPLGAPGSDPLDARHVAPSEDDRLGGSRVPRWDGFTPQPPVLKWIWLPPLTLDPSLGFPASSSDVRRNRAAAKILSSHLDPVSGARVPLLVAMERDRNSHGKHPFEEFNKGYSRSRDQDLRQRLDREQEEHRRQQRLRDREAERASSSSWRSEGERPRQESRAPPPPPPPPRGRDSGRNAGRRQPRQPQGTPGEAPLSGQASGPGGSGAPNQDAAHITCYNCGKQGHVQAACVDEAFCVNCKKVGHLSAMCAAVSKALAPFWAGYSGGRPGFCCLEVPDEELQKPISNSATVILGGGQLSVEQVEDEFKDLVDENWDWQVRQLGPTDFAVVFPSKESLRIAIRGGGLTLPCTKLKAIVTVPLGDPLAAESLQEVWVKLLGVPPPFRHADRLLLATREVGRPIGVDVASLAHPDAPVRMSFGCRKGELLPDHITLFVNMQGYRIQVIREDQAVQDSPPHDLPKFPPGDGTEDKDEDLEETDEERWDGRRGKHVHKDTRGSASAPGGGGGPRKSVPLGSSPASPSACLPLNASDPNLQIPASARSQYGSNLTPTGNIFPLVAQIIKSALPPTSAVGSPPAGDLSIDSICEELSEDPTPVGRVSPTPGKALNLSLEEREEVGWSSPLQGASDQEYLRNSEQRSKLNHDRPSRKLMLEAAAAEISSPPQVLALHQAPAISDANPAEGQLLLLDAPIPALGAPVARAPRSKASPAEAVRKSARSKGASEGPVLERAIRATADKNNLTKSAIDTATPSSSTPAPGTFPSPADFVAFQDSSLAHLLKVAKDRCILFKSTEGSPAQAVALLQARERAQAELLAARRRLEEEEAKSKGEAAQAEPQPDALCGGPEAGSKGEPPSDAGMPYPKGSVGEPLSGSGKAKKSTVSKRRAARRPTPVGHRPVTRQARALSRVSQ